MNENELFKMQHIIRDKEEYVTKAATSYRGCLHQVIIIISIICKDIFRESCRMACAVIWLCSSKQKSEIQYRIKNKQHSNVLPHWNISI